MVLGIMQPYFLPYIGYWQLIKYVDKYIIYDDVNYIKGGWINRNYILVGGQKKMFTISLEGASSFKLIKDISILDDFVKFMRTVEINYAKAPYFREVMSLLKVITGDGSRVLSEFNVRSILIINEYLGINTEIVLSSQISKNCSLRGQLKIIDICKNCQADIYINAIGGKDLYVKSEFEEQGIKLKFLKSKLMPYQQFGPDHCLDLSILDVLMFNSIEKVNDMLDEFELV